jgi:hypothetical protein
MNETPEDEEQRDYVVQGCVPQDLDEAEMAACVAIVRDGHAVDPKSAERELARAPGLVVLRKDKQVVGVGAIKGARADYAAKIAKRSRQTFPVDTPELGYVSVHTEHQGNHLSPKIVSALLAGRRGALFATTDSERMKSVLSKAGFVRKDREWQGKRGQLSLWMKD